MHHVPAVNTMQEEASLPPNNVTAEIADAIAAAVHAYAVEGAIVLMVVQPGEKNSYDQQASSTLCRICISWCSTDVCSGQSESYQFDSGHVLPS